MKFGEASPVIRDNGDIIFDEVEYDQSSIRRIVGLDVCHTICIMCVHHIFVIGACVTAVTAVPQDRVPGWHYLVA